MIRPASFAGQVFRNSTTQWDAVAVRIIVTDGNGKAVDPIMAGMLWQKSAELTGCDWFPAP
jgi:hypothetical protein